MISLLDRVPFVAWLSLGCLLACSEACRGPSSPGEPDALDELAGIVRGASEVVPLAREACGLIPGDEGRYCHGTLDALDDGLKIAAPVVEAVQGCKERQDEACLKNAAQTAREKLPETRRLYKKARGLADARRKAKGSPSASATSSAPAPSAPAAPASPAPAASSAPTAPAVASPRAGSAAPSPGPSALPPVRSGL